MKKEKTHTKKIFAFMILSLVMVSLVVGVVGAILDINIQGPLAEPVNTFTWYGKVADFFGFGKTWAQVLVSIFIFLIIMAAMYDILGLTAFDTPWVKVLIGIGIAGIASVVGFIRTISGIAFIAAGTISGVGIALVIIIAVIGFVLLHFGSGWLASRLIKGKGEIEAARAEAAARKGVAVMKGAGEGI